DRPPLRLCMLFPYTTLFRSGLTVERGHDGDGRAFEVGRTEAALDRGRDQARPERLRQVQHIACPCAFMPNHPVRMHLADHRVARSEEHTSDLQSRENLVCRL